MPGAPPELIKSVPIFADMQEKDIQQIAKSFKERIFQPGDVVTEEGRGGIGFFVIESGTARITVAGHERAVYGPGDHFGEIALIDDGARTATITAESELRCWGLTSWEFRPLVEMNSSIAWHMLQAIAKMLRATYERETQA